MKKAIITSVAILALLVFSCQSPTGPTEEKRNGKVIMKNSSGVTIIIRSYTHNRGSGSARQVLNHTLYPTANYTFKSLLDPIQTYVFLGGDVVTVDYRSRESDPDDPERPLFEGVVDAVVNGNIGIVVKSGGHATVGPQ